MSKIWLLAQRGLLMGFVLLLCRSLRAEAETVARVSWNGQCENNSALRLAMRARGVNLVLSDAENASLPANAVSVAVEVSAPDVPHHYVLRLVLADLDGAFEERTFEGTRCEELHAAVAWMLVIFGKERRPQVPAVDRAESTKTTPDLANEQVGAKDGGLKTVDPSALAPPSQVGVSTNQAHASPERSRRPDSVVTLTQFAFVPRPLPHQLRVGFGAETGSQFAQSLSLGGYLFVDERPWGDRFPAFRLTLGSLSTLSAQQDASIEVSIQRFTAAFDTSFRPTRLPIAWTNGVETGRLYARVSSLNNARAGYAALFALTTGLRAELNLVAPWLVLEGASILGIYPYDYAFRYSSGRIFSRSRHVETRFNLGLSFRI